MSKVKTMKELFWDRLDKSSGVCWEWSGAIDQDGYGKFQRKIPGARKNVTKRTNRIAWEEFYGTIPENMHILHRCDNPLCCRPEHLFVGTALDNMKDKNAKGRGNYSRGENHWSKNKSQIRNAKGQFSK